MESSTIYFIIASVSAFCGALLKLIYDSKCRHLNICFGCVEIERDIEHEVEIEEGRQHPQERRASRDFGERNVRGTEPENISHTI